MTDRPTQPDSPRPEDADRRPAPVGSIVDMRDAPPSAMPGPGKTADAEPRPTIGSTLVGDGEGLPAMARRPSPETEDVIDDAEVVGGDDAEPPVIAPKIGDAGVTEMRGQRGQPASRPSRTDTPHRPATQPESRPAPAAPEASRTAPPAPTAPATVTPRRGGFLPLFLGGVCAAALGAAAAWWAIPRLPAAWQPVAAPAVDTAALTEAASAAARTEIDTRAAAIETRAVDAARQAAAAASDAAGKAAGASLATDREGLLAAAQKAGADAAARLIAEAPASPQPDGTVQATLAAQAQQLSALDQRLGELAQQPAPAPVDLTPLQSQVEALAQRPAVDPATVERLTKLAADAEAATARINAAADQAEARLREAEARSADLSAAADEAARRARAAAAAAAIGEAMQSGAPTQPAIAQLQEAGVEPPAALTAEIPTLETLAAEFPAAARAALRADLKSESASGKGSLVGNFLRAQAGARSVAPREGTDADAVLSRAGDAVQRGAIGQALKELGTLPEPARPAMEAWTAKARAYADAQAALGALSAPAGPDTTPADPSPAPSPATPAPAAPAPAAPAPAAPAPAAPAPTATAPAAPAPSN